MARSSSWLKAFSSPTRPIRRRPTTRLGLENLEARDVPATILVTSLVGGADIVAAFAQANSAAFPGDDTIEISAALAGQVVLAAPLNVNGNFGNITVVNQSATYSLSGNDANRIFTNSNNGSLTLNDILLSDGFANAASRGGAIFLLGSGTLTLNNVTINSSSAGTRGGAVFVEATAIINGGSFTNNVAGGNGGAIAVQGGGLGLDDLLITGNALFQNNTSTTGNGGAVWGFFDASISGATFDNNNAVNGGAVFISESGLVANCIFTNNGATANGGGLFLGGFGTTLVTVTDSSFTGNHADGGDGGAIAGGGADDTLVVDPTTISGNTATGNGGGIAHFGPLLLDDVTLTNNTADFDNDGAGDGGGAWADDLITIQNGSVVDDNVAVNGGGIFSLGDVLVDASTIGDPVNGFGSGNRAVGFFGNGGGISGQTVTIQNGSVVARNDASDHGGGVFANNVFVTDSSVTGNSSDFFQIDFFGNGGGIFANANSVITNSLVNNNLAVNGGGIFGGAVQVTGVGSSVSNNQASSSGGGIFANSSVAVSNSAVVAGNGFAGAYSATNNGGGIFTSGNVQVLSGASVSGNNATNNGGGINAAVSVTVSGTGSTVSNNLAGGDGGGIWVSGAAPVVNILAGASVSGNSAGNNGGGIWFAGTNAASLIGPANDPRVDVGVNVVDATVDGNTAAGITVLLTLAGGGGIFLDNGGIVLIDSTISNNTATGGSGGGVLQNTSDDPFTVIQSTIGGNTAVDEGGGLWTAGSIDISNSTITLNQLTAANNAALGDGAGVLALGGATVNSTIISGNVDNGEQLGTALGNDNIAIAPTGANNLIGNVRNGLVVAGLNNIAQIINTAQGLSNNGGLTETYLLAFGSPAIDQGSNLLGLPDDQRGAGFPRLDGPQVDIGALESTGLWNFTNAVAFNGNVNLFDALGNLIFTIVTGLPAVRIALGDVTGDGIDDVVVGSGPGGGQVRVYEATPNGTAPVVLSKTLTPYGASYRSGVYVAVGNFDGDADQDIVVGPGSSNQPVRVIDYATSANNSAGTTIASFTPFYQAGQASKYTNGVRVASGDTDGDGLDDEVVVSTVSPQAALVQVFNYQPGTVQSGGKVVATNAILTNQIVPSSLAGKGAFVAVGGDLNFDGQEDIIVGTGTGKARFQIFDADGGPASGGVTGGSPISGVIQAFSNANSTQEVRVAVRDTDGDGFADQILTATGPVGAQQVRVFDITTLALVQNLNAAALGIPGNYSGGLFV